VRIWDATNWARRTSRVLKSDHGSRQIVAIAPDGSWLATGDDRGTVQIWATANWSKTATLTGHDREVKAVAVAPNSTLLATTDVGGSVRIWDVTSDRVQTMTRVDDAISACAWISPDRLVLGGAAGWYLFDLITGTESPSAARLQDITGTGAGVTIPGPSVPQYRRCKVGDRDIHAVATKTVVGSYRVGTADNFWTTPLSQNLSVQDGRTIIE
jgi:hypothetical protein